MGNETETTFLMADGSFIAGMGSVLALAGEYWEFNSSKSPAEADAKAMRGDWEVVGKDLRKATKRELEKSRN